jgi:hypothetical protein
MLKKNVFGLCLIYSLSSFAFDLEDYATTYRATRDAYLKAANELQLASGPYKSARNTYQQAAFGYIKSLGNGKEELDQSLLSKKTILCVFSSDLSDRSLDKVKFEVPNFVAGVGVDEQLIIDQEQAARQEYYDALKALEEAGRAKSGAVQAYKKATNEYLHSLSTPMDMTLIKRTEIQNKK